jgi:sigma-B regulation protein RsbU (phosphoserine phosphatase)
MSVKAKMALVVAFVILTLGAMVFLLFPSVYREYRRLRVSEYRSVADYESERLNAIFQQMKEGAEDLALIGEIYYRIYPDDGHSHDPWSAAVRKAIEQKWFPTSGGIWFEPHVVDSAREFVHFFAYWDGKKVVMAEQGSEQSAARRYNSEKWYSQIKERLIKDRLPEGNLTAWTSPYFDEPPTSTLMITVGSGIYAPSGKVVGIATLDWALDYIKQDIGALKPTENSFAVLADPDSDFVLAGGDNEPGGSLSSLPWFDASAPEEGWLLRGGERYVSFYRKIDNGMIFMLGIPVVDMFGDIERNIKLLVVTFVVAAVLTALVTYALLNRFINRPVAYLSAKAAEIGAGNLGINISLTTGDEFGALADTLNKMMSDIMDHVKNLTSVTAEKERMSTELGIAAKIQASVLPSIFPPFPERSEFEIYASMQPALEVGGDFYDFFLVDLDHLGVVIADVSDKGVPAALFMMVAKSLINYSARLGLCVDEVFTKANTMLCENNEADMFVTAFMGILDLRTGELSYVNAAHNPPLLKRAGGDFAAMKTTPQFVMGGIEGTIYSRNFVTLCPGDCLYLYTDGVTEAEDERGKFFGLSAFIESANRQPNSVRELLDGVKRDVELFCSGAPRHDDITMMALIYHGI